MTVARPVQGSFLEGMERPVGPILPSVFQGTNADLMLAVAPLYLTGSVLDVTYGEGKWWDRFTPDPFTKHDLYKLDGVDFRALPEDNDSVDTVCFDPPYIIADTATSVGVIEFRDRYGVGPELRDIDEVGNRTARYERLIVAGLDEALRVSRCFVLVKCMEFVKDKFHDTPHLVTSRAAEQGWVKHDQIVHHTGSGPGGHNIFDVKRARRHHSYLLVFAKGSA